jgi:hypothetical protein
MELSWSLKPRKFVEVIKLLILIREKRDYNLDQDVEYHY